MSRHCKFVAAFTLIEMLVSLVVFSFVVVVTAQLVTSTSVLTIAGGKRADADSQSRALFDLMAIDFGKIVMRPDVDYYFQKYSTSSGSPSYGNDQMAFYSGAPGYVVSTTTPQAGVSLVGYRVNSSYQLERLGKALICSNAANSMVFGPTSGTLTTQWSGIANGTDVNYQVVADLVYRLEFNFLLKSYVDSSGVTHPTVLSVTPWDPRQSHTVPNGLSDVSAIVVAVALLDNASRKVVQSSQYPGMIGALPDASGTASPFVASSSILQAWVGSSFLTSSGIPSTAAANIRLYQRTFYLGTEP